MKSKFVSELSKFVSKHKYLVFVAVFLAFILLFRKRLVIEGLTGMGEYEYLAPIPADNQLSDSVVKAYAEKVNSNNTSGARINVSTPENLAFFKKMLTPQVKEQEVQYYADNGKWPYDSYVLNYIKNRPDFFSKLPSNYTYKNVDDMQKNAPNRDTYRQFIMPTESQMNPPPLSYQIYMGTAQPPSSATNTSNAISTISNATTTTSKDSNYKDFLSLCRKALQ